MNDDTKLDMMKEYALNYAKKITLAVMNNNTQELEKLIEGSCKLRDEVEATKPIERSIEFYYGYIFAYENIGEKILDNELCGAELDRAISYESVLIELVRHIGEKVAVHQEDVAQHLGMSEENLVNLLNEISQLNIISNYSVGNKVILSLSPKGRIHFKEMNKGII